MKRIAVLMLFASACGPSELPDPLPLDVQVTPVGSTTVSLDALRLAVAHRTEEALLITSDVAVTATGTPVLITLNPPELMDPIETGFLLLAPTEQALAVAALDFFAYLDLDGTSAFEPGGVDRVMGLSRADQTAAWIFDLEGQLASLRPEATASYYRATADRYAAFVHVAQPGAGVYLPTAPTPIEVDVSRMAIAGAELICGRDVPTYVDPRADVHLSIDDALQLGTLCEVGVGACESVDVPALDPVELPAGDPVNPFVVARAQCLRRGALEALVLEEQRVRCDLEVCRCDIESRVDAILTSTTSLPAWWPCGDLLDYCESSGPLYLIDPACPD